MAEAVRQRRQRMRRPRKDPSRESPAASIATRGMTSRSPAPSGPPSDPEPLRRLPYGLVGGLGMSLHGELTQFGYKPAAKCSDCHGAHDIRPLGDAPQSTVRRGNAWKPAGNVTRRRSRTSLRSTRTPTQRTRRSIRPCTGPTIGPRTCCWCCGGFSCYTRQVDRRAIARASAAVWPPQDVRHAAIRDSAFPAVAASGLRSDGPVFDRAGADGSAAEIRPPGAGAETWRVPWRVRDTSLWHHMLAIVVLCTAGIHVAHGIRLLWHQPGRNTAGKMLSGPDSLLPNRGICRTSRA